MTNKISQILNKNNPLDPPFPLKTGQVLRGNIERCEILGVNLTVTDYNGVVASIHEAIETNCQIRLNFSNVHVVMTAQNSPELMAALNHPDALSQPDGMPLVWAMKTYGRKIKDRIYGPDTFELCMKRSTELGFKHFFYGSTEETLNLLQKNLLERFPDIGISGSYSPPFRPLTEEEENDVANKINESGANIVWVGLGAPKQEIWVDKMAPKLSTPVVIAIGAAFDFHAGTVKQAPDWMQDHGLEWFYRLFQEPRRLWFRYLYYNPLYIIKFTWERLKGQKSKV